MDANFSLDLRVLLCASCGAPLSGTIAGGQAACRYCGAASVLRARDDVPQVAVRLQIEISGRAPYEATTKILLGPQGMASLAPGVSVPVRVDPQDPSGVLIETQ